MNMFSILALYLFRSSVTIHCLSSSFPPFPGLSQQDSLWVHAGHHHQEPGSQWLGRDDKNQLLQTVSFSIREFFQIIYEITGSGWWQDLGKNVLRPLMWLSPVHQPAMLGRQELYISIYCLIDWSNLWKKIKKCEYNQFSWDLINIGSLSRPYLNIFLWDLFEFISQPKLILELSFYMKNWSKFYAQFNGINRSVSTMLLTLNERIFALQQ